MLQWLFLDVNTYLFIGHYVNIYVSFIIYLFIIWRKLHFMFFSLSYEMSLFPEMAQLHLLVKIIKELSFLCFKLSYIKHNSCRRRPWMNGITQFIAFKYCDSLKTLMGKLSDVSFST